MRSILKQSSFLILAQGIARVIGFLYTIFLARNLTVEEFGIVSTALAYLAIFSVLADFGFNRYLVKEISQDYTKAPRLLFVVTMMRLLATAILFAIASFIIYIFDPDSLRKSVILLAMLAVLPQSISLSIDAIFVALRKLQFSALGLIVLSIVTTIIGVALVDFEYGPVGVIVAVSIGQAIYLLSLIILLKYLKIGIKFDEELTGAKKILQGALPFGILGVLGLLYFRIDIILLSYLKGNYDAGIYGAAYKFFESIAFIPAATSAALFPITANLMGHEKAKVYKLYLNISKVLLLLGLFLTIVFIFFLPSLINLFLPQYSDSITVIRILSLAIPFLFLISPQGIILMSDDRFIKDLIFISIFNLFLNIFLNLVFIPDFGFIAAAWITVISDILGFTIFFFYIRKKLKGF